MKVQVQPTRLDPVTFEIMKNTIRGLAAESSAVLERSGFTPILTEAHDASSAITTADGRLVSNSYMDMLPHVGTFESKVGAVLEDFEGELHPDDVFVMNDPHRGGTHVNDVALIRPIFYEGKLFAFTVQLSHLLDLGGPYPGSFNPLATESYAEGLIIPPTLIFREGKPVKSIFNLIRRNVRMFDATQGDIYALYRAACFTDSRLQAIIQKYGAKLVADAFEEILDYTERAFRAELRVIPDGVFEFEDYGDKDLLHPLQPRIKVNCKMTLQGDKVTLDFTGSDPAPRASWGFARPALLSAVYGGTMFYFPHLAPLNHGLFRVLTVLSTPGSCVDIQPPHPCSGYCSGAYEKVQHAVMGCWALAFSHYNPERVVAGTGNLCNTCIGGIHPKTGKEHVAYFMPECGYGARTFKDGNSFLFWLYAGTGKQEPAEVLERWHPIRYTRIDGVVDSAGAGKFRGGFGMGRNFTALAEMVITCHGDRGEVTPYGLAGGRNGGPNSLGKNKGTSQEENLGVSATGIRLKPGDHITHDSNGGGGYGDPLERDPEAVLEDAIDGYVSLESAREVYGVAIQVVDEEVLDYRVDREETAKLRKRLARRKRRLGYGPGEVHPWGMKVGGQRPPPSQG